MNKAVIFAGTTEGYELCRFLSENNVLVHACAATEYGGSLFAENAFLKVHADRMDTEEMIEMFRKVQPDIVLDATHPYAAQVTKNIRTACEYAGFPYMRVLRQQGKKQGEAVYVESTQKAVQFLEQTKGNILLTTGSKELPIFTTLTDYKNRIYARVLSLPSVLDICRKCGIEGKHLIGMQGPFTKELNAAMLRQFQCTYLVTKDSGTEGGFQEKIDAALMCGVVPVIIGRPVQEEGVSVLQCKKTLLSLFHINRKPHITLLGIGMGTEDTLTVQGKTALRKAELLIGASRMIEAVKLPHHHVVCEYRSDQIVTYIKEHPEYENIVIALSGDVGFYSGAKKLLDQLDGKTEVICGISSVAYFMAKIGLSWDDAVLKSAHGRNANLISLIRHNRKVFAILGKEEMVSELAKELCRYGMEEVMLYVGEKLSYEDEKIVSRPAKELTSYFTDTLCVVCAYNPEAQPAPATHGIPDEEFIRGKAPMTKEEVRAVSLSKLKLLEDSVCYDVGAGTGSVSVEMALRANQGRVYAIEKKEEALQLLKENKEKFAAANLHIIAGKAPQAMEQLETPSHAFIGGSSGNLKEIVETLLDKNKNVRIVINCITLETVCETMELLSVYEFAETEIVQLCASRSRHVGRYHMMTGENPIYIFTCQNPQNMPDKEVQL